MKKITAIFLLFILSLSFTACGEEEKPPQPDTPDTPEEVQSVDLFGYVFKFAAFTDVETFFKPTLYASAYGDKILERYTETQNKFNAVIDVFTYPTPTEATNSIVAAGASAQKYADLIDCGANVIYNNIDYFQPLEELKGFDVSSDKWGSAQFLETLLLDGNHYGFTANYWGMPYPQYIGNLFFRQSVICDEFGLQNPQELYENGEWKWDKFTEYTENLTVIDNTDPSNNRYGFIISGEMKAPRAFIISNGGSPIAYDSTTGLYYNGLSDPKAQAALEYLYGLVEKGYAYFTTDAWEIALDMFKNKQVAFYEAFNKQAFVTDRLATLGEPYSWLPYPCGPDGTYGKSTAQFWYTARFLGVTSMAPDDELENDVLIINDLFEPLTGETKDSWKDIVYSNFFFDELSFKYYIDLYEGGHTDYSVQCLDTLFTHMPNVYKDIFNGKSVSESVAKYDAAIKSNIDQKINKIEAGK